MGYLGLDHWREAVVAGIHSALLSPTGAMLYFIVLCGFVFFADRSSPAFRWIGGIAHALSHLVTGFLVYWFSVYVAISVLGLLPKSIPQYLTAGALIFVLGWAAGSIVMGLYLLIAVNGFGKPGNEAFSSLWIQDWKGFVRARVTRAGDLQLHFVGLQRVSRRWIRSTDRDGGNVGPGIQTKYPAGDRRLDSPTSLTLAASGEPLAGPLCHVVR